MFKNAVIFRINADKRLPSTSELESYLQKGKFAPCPPSAMESYGWVPPRGEKHAPLVENIGGQLILQLMTESKLLPGSVVKDKLKARLAKIEQDTGRKPKGKMAKEIKEEIIHELLPKAFTKKSAIRIWVNPKGKFIVVEAGSIKKCDRIITMLVEAFVDLKSEASVIPLNTKTSPQAAMSTWLVSGLPPDEFTVDREVELKSTNEDKATVKYSRHTLDLPQVVEHIQHGKMPTKLALTHNGRVSFMLADNLTLKKVELLETALADNSDEAGFDTDVALFTGEMSNLIPDLIKALGGEEDLDVMGKRDGDDEEVDEGAVEMES